LCHGLAALGGVAMAFDMPARQAFMMEMTSREHLMNAVSLNSSIVNGARVVGPAVAGLVMARVGMAWCFILNGLSFIAVIVGLAMMRLPKFMPPAKPRSAGQHILEGFAYVAGHRRVRILLLLFSVVGIFGWSYAVLLPAYATDILHVGESGYGLLLSANGFGALVGALMVATYGSRVRPRLMIFGGLCRGRCWQRGRGHGFLPNHLCCAFDWSMAHSCGFLQCDDIPHLHQAKLILEARNSRSKAVVSRIGFMGGKGIRLFPMPLCSEHQTRHRPKQFSSYTPSPNRFARRAASLRRATA
jgi:MFS family permease